nr:hypothetical protein [Scytonema hofmannii]
MPRLRHFDAVGEVQSSDRNGQFDALTARVQTRASGLTHAL